MNKPKALIVASVASMIQQFNMPNIKLLIDMGYDVDVACNFIDSGTIPSSKSKELMDNLDKLNVKYYQVDFDRNAFNFLKNIKAYKQMKKIMLNQYSLVHSHSPIGGAIARVTANKYRKQGLKSIYTAHGFHFYKGAPLNMWILFYPVEKILSFMTDVLITINEEDYSLSKKRMKAESNIYVPGVGIDTNNFRVRSKREKIKFRKKNGYSNEDFIIIYVGELSRRKNQIMLLKAINILKNQVQSLKLILVGTGALENEYKAYVERNNLSTIVDFLGYRDDIPELMGLSDLAVSTATQEGLPVNVMEAMSTGIPIVLTNCRGNKDLIIDERNGYLVNIDDIDEFSSKIKKIYNNPKLRMNMSLNNSSDIKRYSIDKVEEQFQKIYQ